MELTVSQTIKPTAIKLEIQVHSANAALVDAVGHTFAKTNEMPSCVADMIGGETLTLYVDLQTGKIEGWAINPEDLQKFFPGATVAVGAMADNLQPPALTTLNAVAPKLTSSMVKPVEKSFFDQSTQTQIEVSKKQARVFVFTDDGVFHATCGDLSATSSQSMYTAIENLMAKFGIKCKLEILHSVDDHYWVHWKNTEGKHLIYVQSKEVDLFKATSSKVKGKFGDGTDPMTAACNMLDADHIDWAEVTDLQDHSKGRQRFAVKTIKYRFLCQQITDAPNMLELVKLADKVAESDQATKDMYAEREAELSKDMGGAV